MLSKSHPKKKQNIDPLEFCNQISKTFRDLSQTLNLTNTDFIRTTEDRHIKSVQNLWNEVSQIRPIEWRHVRAQRGHRWNERADHLANRCVHNQLPIPLTFWKPGQR